MKRFFILLIVIFSTKSETWDVEVNGHNISDEINGYSGSYTFSDFYLCSERKYRVHYLGDNIDTLSEEFSACQPAGKCKYIDGLAISGGKQYLCRFDVKWPDEYIRDYDIYNSSGGYAGELGKSISTILIFGDENYRNSDTHGNFPCSYEQDVANRIVSYLFGHNLTYDYFKETPIEIIRNKNISASVKLLKPYNINIKGKFIIKIEDSLIIKKNYKGLVNEKSSSYKFIIILKPPL
jgi:hypothetical protein